MVTRFRNYIYKQLNKTQSKSDDFVYRKIIMLFVAFASIIVYIGFGIFAITFECIPLTVTHFVGAVVVCGAIVLLNKRHADGAGIIIGLIMVFSSLTTIHIIGSGGYSILYQYFVLVMMVIVPFKCKVIRTTFAIIMPCIIVATTFFDLFTQPLYIMDEWVMRSIAVINVVVSAVGIAFVIILQQFVKRVIDGHNGEKIKELQAQAYIDPLTQLYNRRYAEIFSSTLPQEQNQSAYIAIADIDDFKLINDTHGHDTGDVVLKIIAKILKDNTMRNCPVFRWGGEEFMAIFFGVTEEEAAECCNLVRRLIQETPMNVSGLVLRTTVTIGLAYFDAEKFEQSYAEADKNLYFGKQNGKNRVVTSMGRELLSKKAI